MEFDRENKEKFKIVFNKAIEVYLDNGIVTKNDVPNMDSRPSAKKLYKYFIEKFEDAICMEVQLHNYSDYSNVIFDSKKFTVEQVKQYMYKYVLHE